MNNNYEISLNRVLNEIEQNLDYVTLEELISISGYSYYHFHRIFKASVGESLKKYIKRLQLEKALLKMQLNQENITQIAMAAGFETSSSFNKAFKQMFEVNPSEYKKRHTPLRKTYPKIEPIRTEMINPIQVYAMRCIGAYKESEKNWNELMEFAFKNELVNQELSLYAIAYDNPDISDNDKLRYDACISNTKEVEILSTPKIQKKVFDGGKYAVFLHKGDYERILDTINSIFGNWLFEKNITLRDIPVIQKFLNNKYEVIEEELLTEIYIPIRK